MGDKRTQLEISREKCEDEKLEPKVRVEKIAKRSLYCSTSDENPDMCKAITKFMYDAQRSRTFQYGT